MMKKTILSLMILFALTAVNAQTEKGNYLIGGNIGKIDATFNGNKSFSIGVTPKVAWFIRDNIAIGGLVELGVSTAKNMGTTFEYRFGPMGRYYFGGEAGDDVERARVFIEADAGFGGNNNSKTSISTNGFTLGVGPGVAYFVNKNIAIEGLAKYYLKTGFGNVSALSGLNIDVGFQIYLPTAKLKSMRDNLK